MCYLLYGTLLLSEHVRRLTYKYSSDARTERDVFQVRLLSQKNTKLIKKEMLKVKIMCTITKLFFYNFLVTNSVVLKKKIYHDKSLILNKIIFLF